MAKDDDKRLWPRLPGRDLPEHVRKRIEEVERESEHIRKRIEEAGDLPELRKRIAALAGPSNCSPARWCASPSTIASRAKPCREIAAWERQRNLAGAHLKWMFTTEKARTKMGRASPRPAAALDQPAKEFIITVPKS